jgi:hypothetical protein
VRRPLLAAEVPPWQRAPAGGRVAAHALRRLSLTFAQQPLNENRPLDKIFSTRAVPVAVGRILTEDAAALSRDAAQLTRSSRWWLLLALSLVLLGALMLSLIAALAVR